MIIELHIIQSFAPSNLNRDDTGAPKDADFGGSRRARISSQSLKRAMRRTFADRELLPTALRATRTKRVTRLIVRHLVERGLDAAEAEALSAAVLEAGGVDVDDGEVGALMFLGDDEVAGLAELALDHREELGTSTDDAKGTKDRPNLKKQVAEILDEGRSAEVALFGRMIAELPAANVEAASQVAHALSTHRVEMDFDYFTAMDELSDPDETGAAMIDTVAFNAATFYRYLNVDVSALEARLDDVESTGVALEAFLRAAIIAEPSGKQNSFAAHNPPSYVLAVVREAGTWSLANAFLQPVRATRDADLVSASVDALESYFQSLRGTYGEEGLRLVLAMALADLPARDGVERVGRLDDLVMKVMAEARAA